VIVLGLGNAALETAQALQPYTAEMHVFARGRDLPQGGKGGRLAYQTHYVGDIRAGRTMIFDTYLLSSLDTFDFDALNGGKRLVVIPCLGSRRCIWTTGQDDCANEDCKNGHEQGAQNLTYWLTVGEFSKDGSMIRHVEALLKKYVPDAVRNVDYKLNEFSRQERLKDTSDETFANELKLMRMYKINISTFSSVGIHFAVTSSLLRANMALTDELAAIREEYSVGGLRFPMDHVVRCFGWVMDQTIFDKSIPLRTTHRGKYPELTDSYQAVGIPGLYFAGTLTHGLDFRKSAGGFIHGFRYTARVLFRLLEDKNYGIKWPSTPFNVSVENINAADELAQHLLQRINEASAPYQMFQTLGDMVLFAQDEGTGDPTAFYMEEVHLKLSQNRYLNLPRLTWTFRYGDGFHGAKVLGNARVGATSAEAAHHSNFLHPILSFFPAGEQEPSMQHFLVEDIFTSWRCFDNSAPFVRFVSNVIAEATRGPSED